jgi:hypothetical protein
MLLSARRDFVQIPDSAIDRLKHSLNKETITPQKKILALIM